MALAAIPTNFVVQQANGQVYLTWSAVPGVTGYQIQRSTDGINFSNYATPTLSNYLDTAVTVGTQYWYQVASVNGSGTSNFTNSLNTVPTVAGQMTLGQLRDLARKRADRENDSGFVTDQELNSYINQSYFELYDLLTTCFEDYYVAPAVAFTTTGSTAQYALPDGVTQFYVPGTTTLFTPPPFYKLLGVDCGLDAAGNAWVTLKKFNFISRNRYVYPNVGATLLGVFNMRYRLLGNTIEFIPVPSGGQIIRIWYIPRMQELLQDSDIADGVSGWTEYIITDAAIKILQKEESDVTILMAQKEALKKRIEESATNRDAGQPDTYSDVRSWGERWGQYGGGGFDGNFGGF